MNKLGHGIQIHTSALGVTTHYYMGRVHREDGPAVHGPDHQIWFYGGKVHREDGPAYIHITNKKAIWYLKGTPLATADFSVPNVDINVFNSYIHQEKK